MGTAVQEHIRKKNPQQPNSESLLFNKYPIKGNNLSWGKTSHTKQDLWNK